MWWARICGAASSVRFFFLSTPFSQLRAPWRQCNSSSFASHTLCHTQTLTRFHLWQIFNTLPQSASFYKSKKNWLQSLALENHALPPPPPLHSTALPLLWAQVLTQKLILPLEAFQNLEKGSCSQDSKPKRTWSRPFNWPSVTLVDKPGSNVETPQTSIQERVWSLT